MDEGPIKRFLETQESRDTKPVLDFAFGTPPYWVIQELSDEAWAEYFTYISDVNHFFKISSDMTIQGVPQNLLNVTGTDYLVVDDYQEGVPYTEIDGKINVIDLLYTEEGVDQYPGYPSDYVF